MDAVLKTKDVSSLLGVSPKTIIRWVKCYNIDCLTNENGHYLFDDTHVEQLKSIQRQLNSSRKKEFEKEQEVEMIPRHVFNQKVKEMMETIERLEYKLNQKADDVVCYQLLNHRAEIEEMGKLLNKLEQRIRIVEEKLDQSNKSAEATVEKRRSFMHIFSS